MNTYLIGDIQGCTLEFRRLIDRLPLHRPADQIWLLGDLVNRGPDSLGTLRLAKEIGPALRVVLGNHDLSLLARLLGPGQQKALSGTAAEIAAAPDGQELIDWLRQQSLAHYDRECLMIHAGLPPQWDLTTTLACARELEALLRGPAAAEYFAGMYGDEPARWSPDLAGISRWRFATNCLTRLRYCRADGSLALADKGSPDATDRHLVPWFAHPERRSRGLRIAFGHWSTLGQVAWPEHGVWGLDTGCVWGGALTALHLESGELIQERGQVYRRPGA